MTNLPEMIVLLKNFFGKEEHCTSQRQAIIKLVEKKDKDKRLIQNWRPISLLNVDVKIISKALSKSLKNVLPSLISENQSAYVDGRFISEGERLIAASWKSLMC